MIAPELAESFVKRISEYTEYNVNIFDKKGNIIASRDPSRVGTFHEAAYNIIKYHQQVVEINDDDSYYGAKQGVNLIVTNEGEPIGVVGVTGEPEWVREIAWIIKMALETMISHDIQLKYLSQQKNTQDLFYSALFNEELPAKEKLEAFAKKLGYNSSKLRVPVLLSFSEKQASGQVNDIIEQGYCESQDMCWLIDEKSILIYKSFQGNNYKILAEQKEYINAWLSDIEEYLHFAKAYMGAAQSQLYYYRLGLENCLWLQRKIVSEEKYIFINDNLREYVMELLPGAEMNVLLNSYTKVLDLETAELITNTIGTLQKNNYNMVKSSEELFIHKNTMAFRLNKIRNKLSLDPYHSSQERFLLEMLAEFLSKK